MSVQTARGAEPATRGNLRGDIEGLRAVAVVLVLVYHAGVPALPGGFIGVDVFFVISGFLITGLLVSELERTGTISLRDFYARRAKRLLPAVAVVLTAVAGLTVLFVPEIRWPSIAGDIRASALYFENWRLADQATNYLAADTATSPLQHFWSLAVEEQFYLLWPLLLLSLGALTRWRAGRHALMSRAWLMSGMLVVAALSLYWSVQLTASDPSRAFFVTTTRLWELALGGGLAIAAHHLARLPRGAAVVLGWAGLAAIAASAVWVTSRTPYPGTAALLPTLGAAAVIAAGSSAGSTGPVFLLGRRPMLFVGALSYSIYLWHWPLIVVAGIRLDGLSVWEGSAVAAASVLPAWLTYRLVENPIRLARPLVRIPSRALALGAACTVAAVAVGFGLQTQVTSVPGSVLASGNGPVGSTSFSRVVSGPLGAEMLAKDPLGDPRGAPLDRVAAIVPDPLNARRDLPAVYAQGCHVDFRHSEAKSCVFGDPSSTTNVVIVGDSHAAQWIPALQQIAVARHWKLTSYTKSSCAWSAGPARLNGRAYPSCDAWNRSVATAIRLAHPTLVLTSSIAARESEQQTTEFVRGVRAAWAPLLADGIPVVVLKDTPHPGIDIAECASEHRTTLTRCAVPRSVAAIGIGDIQEAAVAGQRGVHLISLTDAICPTDECAAVIGSTLVYRDTNHVTATYMQTLAPRLEQALLTYST